ncbi:MAG: hypothetical protein ACR2OL_06850 [Anderseniella sp.]|jgi:hypothetical protein
MQHQVTLRWLKLACLSVIGFGVLGVLATVPALSGATRFFIDLAYWPVDGAPAAPTPESNLLWAILNGIVIGWGVLLWQVTTRVYASTPDLGRTMILTSVGIWFVVDSAGSIAAGAPVNALMNITFLLLFFIPLWRPVRQVEA